MIFEGVFLKRKKREGKGKEFDDYGNLIFEGEFVKGKKWEGQYQEFDDNDNLIFEGVYVKGRKKHTGESGSNSDGYLS